MLKFWYALVHNLETVLRPKGATMRILHSHRDSTAMVDYQEDSQKQNDALNEAVGALEDNDFNYESHTLLIQTFARGSWLGARLST